MKGLTSQMQMLPTTPMAGTVTTARSVATVTVVGSSILTTTDAYIEEERGHEKEGGGDKGEEHQDH